MGYAAKCIMPASAMILLAAEAPATAGTFMIAGVGAWAVTCEGE
jgi:hypothetical protein